MGNYAGKQALRQLIEARRHEIMSEQERDEHIIATAVAEAHHSGSKDVTPEEMRLVLLVIKEEEKASKKDEHIIATAIAEARHLGIKGVTPEDVRHVLLIIREGEKALKELAHHA